MTANHNERDQILHQNLMRLGPRLQLPPEPTDGQRAGWKQSRQKRQQAGRWKGRWQLTLFSGTGALAASIGLLIFAFAFFSSTASPVSAKVIFDELRQALHRSALITMTNVRVDYEQVEGLAVSGELEYGGQIYISDQTEGQLYFDLNLRLSDVSASLAPRRTVNGAVDMKGSLSPGHEWAFVKLQNFSQEGGGGSPIREMLLGLAQTGVYLNLQGVFAEESDYTTIRNRLLSDVSNELHGQKSGQDLISAIQEHAQEITVQESASGLFVLRAVGAYRALMNSEDEYVLGQRLQDWLYLFKNVVLEVGYREDHGVQWVLIRHIGAADGTVRMQLADVDFNPDLFDMAYHSQTTPAPVLDLGTMMRLYRSQPLRWARGGGNSHGS